MLLHKQDLDKVRFGDAKCPTCGTHYDPTYGPCPTCNKRYNLATIAFAVVVLLFLLFWLPLQATSAKAQSPEPTQTCWVEPDGTPLCISAVRSTLTPFVPTSTPVPPPTATPLPTATATAIELNPVHFIYMPIAKAESNACYVTARENGQYIVQTAGQAGTIDVYVDGEYVTTISRLKQLWYATKSKTAVVRGYDINGLVCG